MKVERQGDEMFSTDLGPVSFGPIDVKDTETGPMNPYELADLLELTLETCEELDMADDDEDNTEESRKGETKNKHFKEDLQNQHDSWEDKMEVQSSEEKEKEEEEEDKEEEDEEEEEGIRPILKKRTRLSVSESGSQTEITALDERQERHQVRHSINYFFFFECRISQLCAFAGRKIPVCPNAQ